MDIIRKTEGAALSASTSRKLGITTQASLEAPTVLEQARSELLKLKKKVESSRVIQSERQWEMLSGRAAKLEAAVVKLEEALCIS